jgi:hypothetical protein
MIAAAQAGRAGGPTPAAQLGFLERTTGSVSIQGSAVITGATVMAGDLIATGANSSARLQLRTGIWAAVPPKSQILLPPGAQAPDVEVRQGAVVVGTQSSDAVRISFPGAWVLVKGERGARPLCAVESSGSSSKVTLVAGLAEIHGAGEPVLLHAGQLARVEIGGMAMMPQAAVGGAGGAPVAGKVTREVPQGTVQRQGKEMPLALNDPVDWNDTVHTQNKGRLQITLADGSVLSVGSRSEMKIVKADAEKQQTDIELVTGTVKADVQKVTKSGGHFEIHTKTAVIGVVGTTLLVTSDSKGTTVCNATKKGNGENGEAEVVVTDANGTQEKKLKSGFCAFFPLTGAAVALTASTSASTITGMTTATVVASTAAAASAALSTGVVVAIASGAGAAAIVGGLYAAGTFNSSQPASPP